MIEECFPAHYVAVVDGGRAENQALLQQRFDMIFSPAERLSDGRYSAMRLNI